jgi:hypothetical protein
MYRFDTKRNDLFLDLKEAKANHKARRGGEAQKGYPIVGINPLIAFQT